MPQDWKAIDYDKEDADIVEKHFIADRERRTAEKRRKEFKKPSDISKNANNLFTKFKAFVNDNCRVHSIIRPMYSYIVNNESIRTGKGTREVNSNSFTFLYLYAKEMAPLSE